jgi:probable HAF family extracellular repeat protein
MVNAHALVAPRVATITSLGDLAGGSFGREAVAISADGSTVVGVATTASGPQAFRWTAQTGMVGLGDLPGGAFHSVARSVSADGSVVVGRATTAAGRQAFRWTAAEGLVSLGGLPGAPFQSEANDVSADGSVIVGAAAGALGAEIALEAFRWTAAEGMTGIGALPVPPTTPPSSQATSITPDGTTIVGYSFVAGDELPFRWTAAEGMKQVFYRSYANVTDISDDASVIIGTGINFPASFYWSDATGLETLDEPENSLVVWPSGVTADGLTVVGAAYYNFGGEPYALIWNRATGSRPLSDVLREAGADLGGWTLTAATDISPDGRIIVGFGRRGSGQTEAWIAHMPVPEPSGHAIAGVAACVALLVRRRR